MDENENVSSDGIHCSIGEIVVACDGRGPAVVPPFPPTSPHSPTLSAPKRVRTGSYPSSPPKHLLLPAARLLPPLFSRLHPPQCRESSAGPVSSVCQ